MGSKFQRGRSVSTVNKHAGGTCSAHLNCQLFGIHVHTHIAGLLEIETEGNRKTRGKTMLDGSGSVKFVPSHAVNLGRDKLQGSLKVLFVKVQGNLCPFSKCLHTALREEGRLFLDLYPANLHHFHSLR